MNLENNKFYFINPRFLVFVLIKRAFATLNNDFRHIPDHDWQVRYVQHSKQRDGFNCGAIACYCALIMCNSLNQLNGLQIDFVESFPTTFRSIMFRQINSFPDLVTDFCFVCGNRCGPLLQMANCAHKFHLNCTNQQQVCSLCQFTDSPFL